MSKKPLTYAEINDLITAVIASDADVSRKTAIRLVNAVLMLRERLYIYELDRLGAQHG